MADRWDDLRGLDGSEPSSPEMDGATIVTPLAERDALTARAEAAEAALSLLPQRLRDHAAHRRLLEPTRGFDVHPGEAKGLEIAASIVGETAAALVEDVGP